MIRVRVSSPNYVSLSNAKRFGVKRSDTQLALVLDPWGKEIHRMAMPTPDTLRIALNGLVARYGSGAVAGLSRGQQGPQWDWFRTAWQRRSDAELAAAQQGMIALLTRSISSEQPELSHRVRALLRAVSPDAAGAAKLDPKVAVWIATRIQQLDHRRYRTREAASTALGTFGEALIRARLALRPAKKPGKYIDLSAYRTFKRKVRPYRYN